MPKSPKRSNSRQRAEADGRRGERLAELALRLKGYRILERRFKTKLGEIDLVAHKGDVICFIEVKHRRSVEAAMNAVTPAQSRRINGAANLYMATAHRRFGHDNFEWRYDIIVTGASLWPRHVIDAWRP